MKISLVIQAGGQSSRMGTNKALLLFNGQPLIRRVLQRLLPIANEILIISNQPNDLFFLGYPVFPDLLPGQGALGGLYTALFYARSPAIAIIAVDMPFPSLELLQWQLDLLKTGNTDVVIPSSPEGYEPFHAIYRRVTCLEAVKQALDIGQKRMISWFSNVKVRVLSDNEVRSVDPSGKTFININTPEDLAQAEKLEP
jgi:molybdopterin-guanine dinucleotide biosynthesis protein A